MKFIGSYASVSCKFTVQLSFHLFYASQHKAYHIFSKYLSWFLEKISATHHDNNRDIYRYFLTWIIYISVVGNDLIFDFDAVALGYENHGKGSLRTVEMNLCWVAMQFENEYTLIVDL